MLRINTLLQDARRSKERENGYFIAYYIIFYLNEKKISVNDSHKKIVKHKNFK